MATRTDRVLLLRRTPYGESSLVVHALGRRHGRVHLLAKGAYRRTSRYFCVLDLFHTLELSWAARAGRELDPVTAGELVRRRRHLPLQPDRYQAGAAILELLDLACPRGRPEPGLFDLAEEALERLDGERGTGPEVLLTFQLGFLRELGLAPALLNCAACGGPAPAQAEGGTRATFSAGAGGRLCSACAGEARRAGARVGTLPVEVLETCARVAQGTPSEGLEPKLLERSLDLVSRFLDYHLDARLKSQRAFLAVANRNAPRP